MIFFHGNPNFQLRVLKEELQQQKSVLFENSSSNRSFVSLNFVLDRSQQL